MPAHRQTSAAPSRRGATGGPTVAPAPRAARLEPRLAPATGRRALLAGGTVLALLGALTACDDEKGPEVRSLDDLGVLPTRIDPDAFASLTPEDPRGLSCSLTRITLRGGEQLRALTPDRVAGLTGESTPEEPIEAPEGEGFLLVAPEGEEPPWISQTIPERPVDRVIVRRPDGEEAFPVPIDQVRSGTLLRTVADPAHEDALHAPPGARTGTDIRLWFEIPLDLASAEVHVAATPFPRCDGLAEELAAGCAMTIPLAFERHG